MTSEGPSKAKIRVDVFVLVLGAALLYLVALGARDLWNPNEPIYGEAVREMSVSGDWLVPRVNGVVFPEKPILYFWVALAVSAVRGGVDEFTIRAPSALAGIAGVVLVYLLILPYAGHRRARLAGALLATTFAWWWGARSAQMDLLVSVTTLAAVVAATRVIDHGMPALRGFALAGAAAGLGFLAKGPVGVVCPAIAVVLYAVATGRGRCLVRWEIAPAALVLAAIAAPWFVALAATGRADFVREVLVRQNVTRFLDPWDHAAPWWYYLVNFWADMAPWSLFLPLAAALPGRRPSEIRLDRLAWVWIAGVVLFFSLSASKRSPYILPVAPAVAVLVSGFAERLLERRARRVRRMAALVLFGLGALAFLAAGVVVHAEVLPRYPDLTLAGRFLVVVLVAGGFGVLTGFLHPARARRSVPVAFFLATVTLYAAAALVVLPAADAHKSYRPFARRVMERAGPGAALASWRFWDWRVGYVYYTEREILNLKTLGELRSFWDGPAEAYLLVEGARLDEIRGLLAGAEPVEAGRVGSTDIYLFANGEGDRRAPGDEPLPPAPAAAEETAASSPAGEE